MRRERLMSIGAGFEDETAKALLGEALCDGQTGSARPDDDSVERFVGFFRA
jgi:hypothetical protein